MPVPYARPMYTSEASNARMSDLLRSRGRSEADAIRRENEIRMNLITNLAQIGTSTMSDLAKIKADEPARQVRELQAKGLARDYARQTALDDLGKRSAGMSPNDRAEGYSEAGYPQEGAAIRDVGVQQSTNLLKLEEAQSLKTEREIDDAISTARVTATIPDPTARQTAWAAARSKLLTATKFPPETVPEQFPADPEAFNTLLESGMTAKQRLNEMAQNARNLASGRLDVVAYTEYFNKQMAGVENPEGFAAVGKLASMLGQGGLFGTLYGNAFDPKTAERAKAALTADKAPVQPRAPMAGQDAKGPGFFQLQPDGSMKRMPGATPIPPREPAGERPISAAQKATAERNLQTRLNSIEARLRQESQAAAKEDDSPYPVYSPELVAWVDEQKLRAVNSYRTQLGMDEAGSLDEAGFKPTIAAPKAASPKATATGGTHTEAERAQMARLLMDEIKRALADGHDASALIAQLQALKTRR